MLFILAFCPSVLSSQHLLEADGPGDTYELINSVLAPGANAVENPECAHPAFGRHIAEVWDSVLSQYVFEFYAHVTPDNDRCINFDRQRVEIKTYASSPDDRKGVLGETITYRWKFRLPVGFQPSPNFTHLHQIKAVGGDDGDPIFTLTARKGSPDRLELRHNSATNLSVADLSLFVGTWVECTEIVRVGASGSFSMVIKNVQDGTVILSYSNSNIATIRPDNEFIRPKWGIYRSLLTPSDLRDEAVRFAGFFIQEGTTGVEGPVGSYPTSIRLDANFPNPFNPSTTIGYHLSERMHVRVVVYDLLGREVALLADGTQEQGHHRAQWDAPGAASGTYIVRVEAGTNRLQRRILLMR